MANADLTNFNTTVPGVFSEADVTYTETHRINGALYSGVLATGTHDLFVLPSDACLTGLKLIVLGISGGSGSNIRTAYKVGDTSVNLGSSTVSVSGLGAGSVVCVDLNGQKGYENGKKGTVQLVVGGATLSTADILVLAEYVKADDFITNG